MADLAYSFHWSPQIVEGLTWPDILWWAGEGERIAKEQKAAIQSEQNSVKTRKRKHR